MGRLSAVAQTPGLRLAHTAAIRCRVGVDAMSQKKARPATHATSRAEVHRLAGRRFAGHRVSRHWRGQEKTHRSALGYPHAHADADHGAAQHAEPEAFGATHAATCAGLAFIAGYGGGVFPTHALRHSMTATSAALSCRTDVPR